MRKHMVLSRLSFVLLITLCMSFTNTHSENAGSAKPSVDWIGWYQDPATGNLVDIWGNLSTHQIVKATINSGPQYTATGTFDGNPIGYVYTFSVTIPGGGPTYTTSNRQLAG